MSGGVEESASLGGGVDSLGRTRRDPVVDGAGGLRGGESLSSEVGLGLAILACLVVDEAGTDGMEGTEESGTLGSDIGVLATKNRLGDLGQVAVGI